MVRGESLLRGGHSLCQVGLHARSEAALCGSTAGSTGDVLSEGELCALLRVASDSPVHVLDSFCLRFLFVAFVAAVPRVVATMLNQSRRSFCVVSLAEPFQIPQKIRLASHGFQ